MDFWILNNVISKNKRVKNAKQVGRTNFLHIIKQIFDLELNVPYVDTCCEDTGYAPVRLNKDTNVLEYFDHETKAWVTYVPNEEGG